MLVLVEIASFAVDPGKNVPLVILKESGGRRTLPVTIGPMEASAIAIQSLNVASEKPLTIDLVKLVMERLGGTLDRVVIYDVDGQSLRTRLQIVAGRTVHLVECRASDAIAFALRSGSPIYVAELVFEKQGAQDGGSAQNRLRTAISSLDTFDFGRCCLE